MSELPDQLLIHITPILDESDYHSRAESHLESYPNVTEYLNEIRRREESHNKDVRDFFDDLDLWIVSELQNIDTSFHECSNQSDDTGCYYLNSIRTYLYHSACKIPGVLTIYDKGTSDEKAELKVDNGQLPVAVGDKKILQQVKMNLEMTRDSFVQRVNNFLAERNQIAKIYTDDLLPIIRDIVTATDEEVPLEGGCGLPYCPKPKHTKSEPE